MSDNPHDSSTRPPTWQRAAIWTTCAAIGVLTGTLAWPEPPVRAAAPVPIGAGGLAVAESGDPAREAMALAQRYLAGELILRVGEERVRVRRGSLGTAVELDHLEALLAEARDPSSIMRRLHHRVLRGQPLSLPFPARLDEARALPQLMRIKDRVDRDPVDAHVDTGAGTAVPARPGLALDVHASLERIDRALIDGATEVQLATHVVQPGRTIEGLSDVALDATLAEFSTRHSRGAKARERTHNLRVAAAKIDGHVLEPGEVFDFNEVVGDRTRAAGFKMAPVISYGELVDGMGGGTCQIASTLHAAVFFAGLPIVERHPHSRPSFYIKLGLDAAVAYGALNFKFRNDRPYPVVIAMEVEDGFVRAALHGPERRHEVTFLRRIDETMPFEEKVVEDDELPSGLRVLSQRGIPGFRLTRLRVVRDEQTQVAVREKSADIYPPTTQIWRVGTGPEAGDDFELPRNDAHPEYVADEYMKAVAGPGIDGIDVARKAGRTGTYGWTERENMVLAAADE